MIAGMFLSYRNRSINLKFESVDWFLYGSSIGLKRVQIRTNSVERGILVKTVVLFKKFVIN